MDRHDVSTDTHASGAARAAQSRRKSRQTGADIRHTFEDPLTVQEVPGDNHCVEVLREAWCAWRFDGLAQLTLLGNLKKKGCFVKHQ